MNEEIVLVDKNIIERAIEYQKQKYPERTSRYDKCYRDIGLILNAYQEDVNRNTFASTLEVASKFWNKSQRQIKSFDVEFSVHNFIVQLLEEKYQKNQDLIKKINFLKEIIFQVIEFGPVEFKNWHKSVSSRENTYNWKTSSPSVEIINSILQDLHNYSPSKQRRVRYNLTVIENNDEALKNMIYESTKAEPLNANSRYNPQVLAPWIFAFSIRTEANAENRNMEHFYREGYLDIGIAASYIALAAINYGVDVGFCGCIQDRLLLKKRLGITPVLFLGIGYKNTNIEYYCPIYKKQVSIPNSNFDSKPEIGDYIKFLNGEHNAV
jgi:hypothetical protein